MNMTTGQMSFRDPSYASRLLERLLLFSAGLCRKCDREQIIAAYPKLHEFMQMHANVDACLMDNGGTLSVVEMDGIIATLKKFRSTDLILATAHYGHFIAFVCACSLSGIPLAACYRSASQFYLEALRASGVALIDLDTLRNVRDLFAAFDRERSRGRFLILTIDAPFASRQRYEFLGYSISISCLPSLYAKRTNSALLPIVTSIEPTSGLSYRTAGIIEDIDENQTQGLLKFLESSILMHCQQYWWISNSALLTDPAARHNALLFLNDALEWRRRYDPP